MANVIAKLTAAHGWLVDHPEAVFFLAAVVFGWCIFALFMLSIDEETL